MASTDAAAQRLTRLEDLFAGGPDTVCRTVYRDEPGLLGTTERVEYVEVPMADLRAAFEGEDAAVPVTRTAQADRRAL